MATGAVSSSLSLPSITCDSLRLVRDARCTATGVVFGSTAVFLVVTVGDAEGLVDSFHRFKFVALTVCFRILNCPCTKPPRPTVVCALRRVLFKVDVARCKRWGDFVPCGDSLT